MRAPASATRRPWAPRARRGATIPLVLVLLTALVGAAALAIDLGRLQLVGTEAQAAADAAALGAVRSQQLWPTNIYGSSAVARIRYHADSMARLNRVNGVPARVLSADVAPMTFDPRTRATTVNSVWNDPLAVRVVVRATVNPVVGNIVGLTPRTVERTATAWLASVNGASCVRPLAFDYTRFYESGVKTADSTYDTRYSRNGLLAPEFTQWDIANTRFGALPNRGYMLLPPGQSESLWRSRNYNTAGRWRPVDFTGGGGGDFVALTGAAIGSSTCRTARAAVGDTLQPLVASASNVTTWANAGMAALCNRNTTATARNAHCLNPNGTIGVRTRIMLTDSLPGGPRGFVHRVREVGVVRVMCYFQYEDDVCGDVPMNEPTSRGTWSILNFSKTGYPSGTFVMYVDTPVTTDLGADIVLGNKPSFTQRLILVR